MTATLDDATKKKQQLEAGAEEQAARELVRRAREQGLSLTGPDGLLKQLNEEITEHLGDENATRVARAPGTSGTGPGPRRC